MYGIIPYTSLLDYLNSNCCAHTCSFVEVNDETISFYVVPTNMLSLSPNQETPDTLAPVGQNTNAVTTSLSTSSQRTPSMEKEDKKVLC